MSLVYDLSKVRGRFGQTFPFTLYLESFSHNGFTLKAPLVFSGTLKAEGFFIFLEAEVKAQVESLCGRCLAPLDYEIETEIRETLLFQGESDRVDTKGLAFGELGEKYWLYDKLEYDFTPLVADSLLENLPLAPVCPEGCAVLEEAKEENEDEITLDPRWASLAWLKQDDGEV